MKETESKAAQKKRKLSSEVTIKTENDAKKRKEALLSPSSSSSSLSPKKTVVSTSVPPSTAPITPKMSSEEKNKDSFRMRFSNGFTLFVDYALVLRPLGSIFHSKNENL